MNYLKIISIVCIYSLALSMIIVWLFAWSNGYTITIMINRLGEAWIEFVYILIAIFSTLLSAISDLMRLDNG